MRNHYIYFLTTFGISIPRKDRHIKLVNPRTVGFFKRFKDAEKIVKYNICDICECNYYRVALIEKVKLGMYTSIEHSQKWWYDIRTTSDCHYKYCNIPNEIIIEWEKERNSFFYSNIGETYEK